MLAGELTILDHAFTMQPDIDQQMYDIVDKLKANADSVHDSIAQTIIQQIDIFSDEFILQRVGHFDIELEPAIERIRNTILKSIANNLQPAGAKVFETLGQSLLDDNIVNIQEHFVQI